MHAFMDDEVTSPRNDSVAVVSIRFNLRLYAIQETMSSAAQSMPICESKSEQYSTHINKCRRPCSRTGADDAPI